MNNLFPLGSLVPTQSMMGCFFLFLIWIEIGASCPFRKKILIQSAHMDGILNITVTNVDGCILLGLWANNLEGQKSISYEAGAVDYYGQFPNPFSAVSIGSRVSGQETTVYTNLVDDENLLGLIGGNRYTYMTKDILYPNFVLNVTIVAPYDFGSKSKWRECKPRSDIATVLLRLTESSWPNRAGQHYYNGSMFILQLILVLVCIWFPIIGIWRYFYRRREYLQLPSVELDSKTNSEALY